MTATGKIGAVFVAALLFYGGFAIPASPVEAQPPGLEREGTLPPGLEKEGKRPSGFDKGRKEGWRGEYPPGWEKRSEEERQHWRGRVREGRAAVSRTARERGLTEDEAEAAADDYEKRIRRGMDPEESEARGREAIERGERRREAPAVAGDDDDRAPRERGRPDRRLQERPDSNETKEEHRRPERGRGR